ncbi:MAG: ABC transporter substrate-binding protein [Proteobacteria bacterium]|nr:ABC transporter substrate-binding protein [Pseudomonadota bacterium]
MKKNIILIAAILIGIGLWWQSKPSNKKELPVIGVIQAIEHPALDQTRKGIFDELQAQGFSDKVKIDWRYESAQGNPSLATQIAQKFIGQKAKTIVTIGTTVSQSALQAIQQSGSGIPLVFASVTSPVSAKLITSDKKPEKGVCGVSNYVSASRQFEYFKKLLPNMKRIGVVYSPGEANSIVLNEEMLKAAENMDLEIVFAAANKTSDVSAATQSLLDKVDAIFVNNDNIALASFDSIVASAKLQNIPVFVSDIDCIQSGALAALGADQYELGRQVGKIVADILKQKNVELLRTMEYAKVIREETNKKVADEMKIALPEAS